MTKWIILTGAPSIQQVCDDLNAFTDRRDVVSKSSSRWLDLKQHIRDLQAAPPVNITNSNIYYDDSLTAHILAANDGSSHAESAADAIEASHHAWMKAETRKQHEANHAPLNNSESQDYPDSLLPPATQILPGANRRTSILMNQTTEQSMLNLPSWNFTLASVTSLSDLPTRVSAPLKVNLLGYIHELEAPGTIPLKQRSVRTGKMEVERASMTLLEESGTSLTIVMWDDFAELWAGEYLRQGDVVFLERISLSEYKGQLQGTANEGSRVQICYRTIVEDEERDHAFRPDLELAWDPISKRVKGLCEMARRLA